MSCPAENTWLRYVGGELPALSLGPLEEHLDTCASCRLVFVKLARDSATDPTIPAKVIPLDLVAPQELARGALVDRYVILDTLGRGGMGVVYKAFDPELDRPIALKLVAVNGAGSDADDSRARLSREAKTLAQLSHPNVVAVHDVGSHEGDVFVAMEFVAGSTLRRWLQDAPRTPREILGVFRAAGAGLAAAHALGIVHRDFKPENVIVGDDGRVRVLDFGLARPGERRAPRPSLPELATIDASGADLTREGTIMGTPAYMAPEQDAGGEADHRSDQFSFCAALYEALFAHRPFSGHSYQEIASQRLAGAVRAMPSVRGVPARVRRALLRGLSVAPADRHAAMPALLAELGTGPRPRTKAALAALALTTLGAGGWATWVAMHEAPSAGELCARSGREVERVWNDKRHGDLLASFATFDARAHGEHIASLVDRYTVDWTARRIELCKQMVDTNKTRAHDAQLSAQLSCLNSRLENVDSMVTVLIHAPTPDVIKASDGIAAGWKPLAQCETAPPAEIVVTEETRERWKPALKGLVDGQLALAAGRYDEAERHASTIVQWATEHDEPQPLAGALAMLGIAQSRGGHPPAVAKATLLRAVRAATAVREEGMAVEAWLEIISLAFNDRTMLDGIDAAIIGVELAATRLDASNPLHTQVAYKLGTVHVMRGEIDEAIEQLTRARAKLENDPNARYDVAGIDSSLGVAYLYKGDFAQARTYLDSATAIWRSLPVLHANLASSLMWRGEWHGIQHDFAAAVPYYAESLDVFSKLGPLGASSVGKARFMLGWTYARAGDCSKARPLIAQAREEILAQTPKPSALTALTLVGEATCELAEGRARKAVALLEEALPLTAITPVSLTQVERTQFTLARALVAAKQDRRRAIALAKDARDGFAKYPGARADLAEVDAWLAANR